MIVGPRKTPGLRLGVRFLCLVGSVSSIFVCRKSAVGVVLGLSRGFARRAWSKIPITIKFNDVVVIFNPSCRKPSADNMLEQCFAKVSFVSHGVFLCLT